MQIETSKSELKQAGKSTKTKHIQQAAKLALDITPQAYRGMRLLGNYSAANKIQPTDSLRDPRLSCLDYAYFTNRKVLDVGSGDSLLTIEIAMRCLPAKIVALDIDGHLLERAKRRVDKIVAQNALYCSANEAVQKRVQELPVFFREQFERSRGRSGLCVDKVVEIMAEGEEFSSRFPHNFSFYNENLINIHDREVYDTILLMKTTKWMHLAFGDKGLTALFEKAAELLLPGGYLVLEYPLYRSYKKKRSLNSVYAQNLQENIHIDPLTFSSLLGHMGFTIEREVEANVEKGVKHPIAVFRKAGRKEQEPSK